jgi:MraZ protein
VFYGEYSHTIDDKGRLSVPAKFREHLERGVVATRGLDTCLFLYRVDDWHVLAEKLASLPLSDKNSRAFARLMLAGAWDAKLDSQGRVLVADYLREYAGLGKHVTVTGLHNRIEVWAEDAWYAYRTSSEQKSDAIAAAMTDLGV